MTCLECEDHNIIPDPDPNDWLCDDDVAIVCRLEPNGEQDLDSAYMADKNPYRLITRSCRPHHKEDEAKIPTWCPKKLNVIQVKDDSKPKQNYSIFAGRWKK